MSAPLKRFALALLLLTPACIKTQTAGTRADGIHIEISGLRNDKGVIACALFASADGFPKNRDKAVAHASGAITQKAATCEFPAVAPGTYAVSVFHDENSNGKLDTNFMGIPKEGVGASNNASGHFGPPKFEAAAFKYTGGPLDLKITIRYL